MSEENEKDFPLKPEEIELLSREKELLAKKEQGQNLEENEREALENIASLKSEISQRLQKKDTSENQAKDLQSALKQKEHYRDKYEDALIKLKDFEKKNKTKSNIELGEASPLDVVKLGKALNDYSEEEVDFIIQNARSKDVNGILSASKNEWVKDAIEARRQKVENENKKPAPSPPGFTPSGKSFQEIKDMDDADFYEFHNKHVEKSGKKKQGI